MPFYYLIIYCNNNVIEVAPVAQQNAKKKKNDDLHDFGDVSQGCDNAAATLFVFLSH